MGSNASEDPIVTLDVPICCDRSDAQNVVREALAEEREARALEREVRAQELPQVPTLRDLLHRSQAMVLLTQIMLDQRPQDWSERDFVESVQQTMQSVSTALRAVIRGETPPPLGTNLPGAGEQGTRGRGART